MPSESLRQEDCRANVFQHHPGLGDARRRAAAKANELLSSSDKEWERIRPLMRVKDDATFQALKRRSVAENQADAEVLYQFIRELGGEKLVGPSMNLAPGTFWKNVELNTAE
jgi:NitT/TauT family transport system substrate-binding protein